MSVTRDQVDAICASRPGSTQGQPPEELSCWKVGGKMFACFSSATDANGVSVKCPDAETATMLIDAGAAIKARYFHKSWVTLPFADTTMDEIEHRVAVSYDKIFSGLPKAIRNTLPQGAA
ncbi:MAG: MmcQ/YjbR family DNA-binding protein [Pseudomonadota bacterium]